MFKSIFETFKKLGKSKEKETVVANNTYSKPFTAMLKVYLAIPYTGIEESSFKQVNEATALILNSGKWVNVFSPISHSHHISEKYDLPGNWEFWEAIDYQFIDWADEVWILIPSEGSELVNNSTGVQAEKRYALRKNIPVKYFTLKQLEKYCNKIEKHDKQ